MRIRRILRSTTTSYCERYKNPFASANPQTQSAPKLCYVGNLQLQTAHYSERDRYFLVCLSLTNSTQATATPPSNKTMFVVTLPLRRHHDRGPCSLDPALNARGRIHPLTNNQKCSLSILCKRHTMLPFSSAQSISAAGYETHRILKKPAKLVREPN